MAEIKSTLELAMERTKKIAISEKEREEIKRNEILQKVTGLSNRFLEGHIQLNEIMKEIERMEDKTRSLVKERLLSQWINALTLGDEDERLLKGIESLKGEEMGGMREKFQHLLSQYQLEKEKAKQEVRAQSLEALKKVGIYGSAVEPNIENDRIWKEKLENLKQIYSSKLKDLKEQLRTL